MKQCWTDDPKLRPSFTELVEQVREILDWDSSDDNDTLYVNVEPCSPPASPTTASP